MTIILTEEDLTKRAKDKKIEDLTGSDFKVEKKTLDYATRVQCSIRGGHRILKCRHTGEEGVYKE